MIPEPSTFIGRVLSWMPVVSSAALVTFAISVALERPLLAAGLFALALTVFVPPVLARVRFRRLLLSGDVPRIVDLWRRVAASGPSPETAVPLMNAIAFASYGWVSEARAELARLGSGWASEPNIEHRLFVETLLEAFDGDRDEAVQMAARLSTLPLPQVSAKLQGQVSRLRAALGALARAFAHTSTAGDLDLLEHMARTSPLVSWAMRYAGAIAAIDMRQPDRALALVKGAPRWPPQSAFRAFHEEIARWVPQLARQVKEAGPAGQP